MDSVQLVPEFKLYLLKICVFKSKTHHKHVNNLKSSCDQTLSSVPLVSVTVNHLVQQTGRSCTLLPVNSGPLQCHILIKSHKRQINT